MASRGLAAIYDLADEATRQELLDSLMSTLTGAADRRICFARSFVQRRRTLRAQGGRSSWRAQHPARQPAKPQPLPGPSPAPAYLPPHLVPPRRCAAGAPQKRRAVKLTEDSKVFEAGQLGAAPGGGGLTTYKELCSLATELGQPDLGAWVGGCERGGGLVAAGGCEGWVGWLAGRRHASHRPAPAPPTAAALHASCILSSLLPQSIASWSWPTTKRPSTAAAARPLGARPAAALRCGVLCWEATAGAPCRCRRHCAASACPPALPNLLRCCRPTPHPPTPPSAGLRRSPSWRAASWGPTLRASRPASTDTCMTQTPRHARVDCRHREGTCGLERQKALASSRSAPAPAAAAPHVSRARVWRTPLPLPHTVQVRDAMAHIWHALLDDPKQAVTDSFDGALALRLSHGSTDGALLALLWCLCAMRGDAPSPPATPPAHTPALTQ